MEREEFEEGREGEGDGTILYHFSGHGYKYAFALHARPGTDKCDHTLSGENQTH